MSLSEPAGVVFRTGAADGAVAAAARIRAAERSVAESIALSVTTDIDSIADEWRRFEQAADCTVFQTFAWQSAWLRNIGNHRQVTPAIVAGRGRDGELLFLLPLAVESRGAARRLIWLASDLCDYNGPLLAGDFAERVGVQGFAGLWREICRLLRQHPSLRHDAVVLEKMPEMVGGQPNPFMELGVMLNPSGAYLTHLPATFEAFYAAKRSNASRKRDRWKQRRLADQGEVHFVTAKTAAEIGRVLDALFGQKSRALVQMGAADIFANPGQAQFYRDVATEPQSTAHVSCLDVGPIVAAANFGLVFRGRYYHVLASYTEGEVARFGPGAAHLQRLIRYAIERGCSIFDFTIGDEPYKREWCDEELKLHDLRQAATPLGHAVLVPSLALSRAKRFIKHTPFLWHAAQRFRALAASRKGLSSGSQRAPEAPDSED